MNSENNKPPFIGDILKVNFNIPEAILDKYYSLVPQPKIEDISENYRGKPERYNSPFIVDIDGAYPLMSNWQALTYKVNDPELPDYTIDSIFEALKEYVKGFYIGYDTFIEEKILKNSLSKNEVYIAQKIMDYLSSPFQKIGGFSETRGTDVNIFDGWFNDGINAGYFYHAWIYIFENHRLFELYFDQAKPKPEAKPLPELPAIFADKNHLVKLVKLLKENNFVSEEAGQLLWTGKYNENARGEGLQLVTLSEVCRPFYNSNYNAKQLNHAWTKYFNYKMSAVKWQDGEKDKHISDSYRRLFQFVGNIS